MNQKIRNLIFAAFLIVIASVTARANGMLGGVAFDEIPMLMPLSVLAVQPDLLIELRRQSHDGQVEDLKQKAKGEMTLAIKERERGNIKAMEKHLKKAAELGSREAQALLKTLQSSKK